MQPPPPPRRTQKQTRRRGRAVARAKSTRKTPAAKVRALTAAHPLLIFARPGCPFCAKAVAGAALLRVRPHVVDITQGRNSPMRSALVRLTGTPTVPLVFVRGAFFGGGDATWQAAQSGALKAALGP